MEVVKWNLSLLIEIARKTKKMLTRADLNKMKVENGRRVKEMEEAKREKKGGGRKKRKNKIDVEKKTEKKMRQSIEALKEI